MYGQEPRLPVDFLLGRVQDVVPGTVHDWVVEHQSRLQVAFEDAADCRNTSNNQHVQDALFIKGQLVYLQDFSKRGHNT